MKNIGIAGKWYLALLSNTECTVKKYKNDKLNVITKWLDIIRLQSFSRQKNIINHNNNQNALEPNFKP